MKIETAAVVKDQQHSGSAHLPLATFDYHSPTRVVFGAGTLSRLGELARELGGTRVLLVTDPGLEKAGHPQRAVASLEEAELEVFVFDDVEENPTSQHVEMGVEFARPLHVDMIVAVGGGSAMDCAKGINFLITNGGHMRDYKGFGKAKKPMLPSIGVPTTAGTGSEAQSYALIADDKTHLKMACGDRKAAFVVAILDPEVTVSQPEKVTALTGIDALSHAVESYVTAKRNKLAQMFALEGWKLLEPNLERVLCNPNDLEARGRNAGRRLSGRDCYREFHAWLLPCLRQSTPHYGITHGLAIGILLPHVVRFNASAVEGLYHELAQNLNVNPRSASEAIAQRITDLLKLAKMPMRLNELSVTETILPVLAEEANQQWTAQFNPRSVGEEELLEIYRAAM